jgi:hypothetical protein
MDHGGAAQPGWGPGHTCGIGSSDTDAARATPPFTTDKGVRQAYPLQTAGGALELSPHPLDVNHATGHRSPCPTVTITAGQTPGAPPRPPGAAGHRNALVLRLGAGTNAEFALRQPRAAETREAVIGDGEG